MIGNYPGYAGYGYPEPDLYRRGSRHLDERSDFESYPRPEAAVYEETEKVRGSSWSAASVGLGLFAFAAAVTIIVVPSVLASQCRLPHQRCAPAPAPAPVYAETSDVVFNTTTPFVYAVAGYADTSFVAAKWQAGGQLYHPLSPREKFGDAVPACPTSPCTVLIEANATHIRSATRFPGLKVDFVYANETHVVVQGTGAVASGWVVPAAKAGAAIDRAVAGTLGATLVYERLGDGGIYFTSSALVVPPASVVSFTMNRGFASYDFVGAGFGGQCAEPGEWIVTPLQTAHTGATEQDRTIACDTDAATAGVVLYSGLQIEAVWRINAPGFDGLHRVGVESVSNEGGSFLLVYGAYAASGAPGEGAGEFIIPGFTTTPDPGALPTGVPAQTISSWSNAWPAGFVAKFGPGMVYESYLRFEMVASHMALYANGAIVSVCGDTSGTETINVFNFSTFAAPEPVVAVTDPEPLATSPICCDYGFSDGSLQECDLYTNAGEMSVLGAIPRLVSLLSDGNFTRSDDLTPPATTFTYSGTTYTVEGVSFLDTAKTALDDTWQSEALPYDGSTPGAWVYDPATQRVWYGSAAGVDWTD